MILPSEQLATCGISDSIGPETYHNDINKGNW